MGTAESSAARPLAVTMGDPAGIGLEIALLAWSRRQELALPPFVLIADPEALAERARAIGLSAKIEAVSGPMDYSSGEADRLSVLPVRLAAKVRPGKPDPANAPATIEAIERAVALTVSGETAAVVTNPIHKAVLASAGFAHPGHTEFLGVLAARHFSGRSCHPVMMLACEALRVVPLTVHIPLAAVPGSLSPSLIERTARTTQEALRDDFAISRPRIAIAGLNPHAGESGTMGREEIEVIAPTVAALRSEGLDVTGPHAADTLFHAGARRAYDAAIAMYHDQALIPIKTLAFDTAVNVTLGLPFVRTSPDHGTAFDIAGKGVANPESLIQAMRLAAAMARARGRAATAAE
jgi:4-hydroxythreonine-4-phosphate dehydrogenase